MNGENFVQSVYCGRGNQHDQTCASAVRPHRACASPRFAHVGALKLSPMRNCRENGFTVQPCVFAADVRWLKPRQGALRGDSRSALPNALNSGCLSGSGRVGRLILSSKSSKRFLRPLPPPKTSSCDAVRARITGAIANAECAARRGARPRSHFRASVSPGQK